MKHRSEFESFLVEMKEKIMTVHLVETKFRMLKSKEPKLMLDTHGFRRPELKALLKRFFTAMRNWATKDELNTNNFLKKSTTKARNYYADAEIEQGNGTHRHNQDSSELTISEVLGIFKETEIAFQTKQNLSFEYQQDIQNRNRIKVRVWFKNVIDYGDNVEFPSLLSE